jgi:hypothetical protein
MCKRRNAAMVLAGRHMASVREKFTDSARATNTKIFIGLARISAQRCRIHPECEPPLAREKRCWDETIRR